MLSGLRAVSYYPDLACFLLLAFLAGAPCNSIEICEVTGVISEYLTHHSHPPH